MSMQRLRFDLESVGDINLAGGLENKTKMKKRTPHALIMNDERN